MTHEDDIRYMQQALEMAREGVGLASPNPTVGCVLVKDRRVIGRGFHMYAHRDHAEIVALKQAGVEAEGATAYVTLEPCSHTGRTGPCADALIHMKVARVVAATVDPNPDVSGRGLARIKAAGIDVTLGVMQEEARALNDAFAKFITTGRPFVTLKAALSVDGRLAPPPEKRVPNQPFWLTGALARNRVQQMRHASDAILTGIGTVLADDPELTDRTGLPRRNALLRVVLDSQLRTPVTSKLVKSTKNDLLIFCAADAPVPNEDALVERGVQVQRIASAGSHLHLEGVLTYLAAHQVLSVIVEGGSQLNGALLKARLVDRIALFYSQTELGADALPFASDGVPPFQLEHELSGLVKDEIGQDTLVSGYLRNPWRD